MASGVENLIREAIQAHRNGDNNEARSLLLQAVEVDDTSEQAWLWLSAVVDSPEDQQTCLENVLTINPNNEKAQQGLRILREKMTSAPPPEPPKPQSNLLPDLPDEDEDPFAGATFAPTPDESESFAAPFASFGDDDSDDDEEMPDVSAWGVLETSSASAAQPRNQPTSADYNEWISGLNIGSSDASDAFGTATDSAGGASPFIGDSDLMDEDTPFELDADVFNFKQDTFSKPPEGLADALPDASPFSSDLDFDDDFDDEPAPSPARSRSAPLSPVSSPPAKRQPLDDIAIDDEFDEDSLLIDDDDDFDMGGADPEEFFRLIPSEIKPTRMPGTRERYPVPLIIGLLLLFALNIGAVALVFLTLSGGLA